MSVFDAPSRVNPRFLGAGLLLYAAWSSVGIQLSVASFSSPKAHFRWSYLEAWGLVVLLAAGGVGLLLKKEWGRRVAIAVCLLDLALYTLTSLWKALTARPDLSGLDRTTAGLFWDGTAAAGVHLMFALPALLLLAGAWLAGDLREHPKPDYWSRLYNHKDPLNLDLAFYCFLWTDLAVLTWVGIHFLPRRPGWAMALVEILPFPLLASLLLAGVLGSVIALLHPKEWRLGALTAGFWPLLGVFAAKPLWLHLPVWGYTLWLIGYTGFSLGVTGRWFLKEKPRRAALENPNLR